MAASTPRTARDALPSLLTARDRPLRHAVLCGLTLVACTFTFQMLFAQPTSGFGDAFTFALCLLLILGSHEMGHWFLARHHRVDASLPYFIPTPMIGFGTLGAVIRLRGRIPDRRALVDIGASGPLAGLAVAIPLLIYGLSQSPVVPAVPSTFALAGPESLWGVLSRLPEVAREGAWLQWLSSEGAVGLRFGDNLLLLGLKRGLLGIPPGFDVAPHPVVLAAWVGLLVTMLNLLPIGQLDGGHLAYALFGQRARWVGALAVLGLFALALLVSAGWTLWLVIVPLVIGLGHPPVERPEVGLTAGRRWLCALCALALFLCLMPLPIQTVYP